MKSAIRLSLLLWAGLGAAVAPVGAQRGSMPLVVGRNEAAKLAEEVMVLQRLVALQLSDTQIDQLLKIYAEVSDDPPAGAEGEALRELRSLKQRLLRGERLAADEVAKVREALRTSRPATPGRTAQRGQGASRQTNPSVAIAALSPRAQAMWEVLSAEQHATLSGTPRGARANPQRSPREAGQRAIEQLGRWRDLDEADWDRQVACLINGLAATAGPAGSDGRQNMHQMVKEFLQRLKTMDLTTFETTKDVLATELVALLPGGFNGYLLTALINPATVQQALESGPLHYCAPDLLREIKATRARPHDSIP